MLRSHIAWSVALGVCVSAGQPSGVTLPVDPPVETAAAVAPAFGRLTTDRQIFRDGGAPWRWRGVSAFKLAHWFEVGDLAKVDAFLKAFSGYNLLRVWDYTPADARIGDGRDWEGQEWPSTPPRVWVRFLDYVGRQGFRVELTLLTDDDPARIEPARQLVAALVAARPPNLLFEAGNEPTTHKNINTAALRASLEAAYREAGVPYTSGDYEDGNRFYGTYWVGHTGRDAEWPRRAHVVFDAFRGIGPRDGPGVKPRQWRVPAVCDEPGKWEDVGRNQNDWRAYAGACALLGAGMTFHFENGKFARLPTKLEATLAAVTLSALNAFPDDAPLGPYSEPADRSLRTYIVGKYAVRIRPSTTTPPFKGTAVDKSGVLWRLGGVDQK